MGRGLSATVDSGLNTFNTLALQTQDEAYTLAYYLLGDESGAERATQSAFNQLYRHAGLPAGRFRLEVLRRVLASCQQQRQGLGQQIRFKPAAHPFSGSGEAVFGKLLDLQDGERGVLVLVDVLGLDYEQAAQVLGSSRKQVGKLLAQARINLSHYEEIRQ